MTISPKIKFQKALSAWIERFGLTSQKAAEILSLHKKVTASQVEDMRCGHICPNKDTMGAWAVEINSSPTKGLKEGVNENVSDFFEEIFGPGFKF